MPQNAIIILAAGNASRMGKAKQLLPFNNKTFIQHITDEAQKATGDKVVLVLGAYAESIKALVEKTVTHIAVNHSWQTGMAGSVQTGMRSLLQSFPGTENVIITVADQPFVSAELFGKMFAAKDNTHKNIVACRYRDTIGTPVLFNKKYFPDLLRLQGQQGAKSIVMQYEADMVPVAFDAGAIDIDTEEDYKWLILNK